VPIDPRGSVGCEDAVVTTTAPSSLRPSTSAYLAGNFAPVREEITAFDLAVTGSIPEGLNGRLLRIGPNPVSDPDPNTYHWFTGNGMVHGVRIRDGAAEWYRNRYVADDTVTTTLGRPTTPGPRHGMGSGTANTNVIGHADSTFAIVEAGGLPVELSYELDTIAMSDFGGTLPGSFTAHPKLDPATGELHAVVYYFEWDHLQYLVVGANGSVTKRVDIPVPGKPMTHDCAITESKVLIFDQAVTFDLDLALNGRGLPYRWDPDYGCRIGLLARDAADASTTVWCEVDLSYVYHPLNAYDLADGRVVVDVVKHPKMFDRDQLGPNEGPPTLWRWTIDPTARRVHEQQLDDRGQEFPRHDERIVGRPHRYGYTAAFGAGAEHGPAYKHDLVAGTSLTHDYGLGRVTLEPVFVPAHDDAPEDDGYVMSYVYDATTDRSDVVILHAQDFDGDPVATIHLPARVPFGFHGNWVPDAF
jgi:carotenoid cleavage dioxygenase-like enzyme